MPPIIGLFWPIFVSDLGRNGGRNRRETLHFCILQKYTAFKIALVEGGGCFFQGLFSGTVFELAMEASRHDNNTVSDAFLCHHNSP